MTNHFQATLRTSTWAISGVPTTMSVRYFDMRQRKHPTTVDGFSGFRLSEMTRCQSFLLVGCVDAGLHMILMVLFVFFPCLCLVFLFLLVAVREVPSQVEHADRQAGTGE